MAHHDHTGTQASDPVVGIIMGSDSDLPVMKAAAEQLDAFGIPYEVTVVSAHRTPMRMVEYAQSARQRGLKTMLGCMIESSVLISAGAHLAELTDYLDLDGNILITNDPFVGVQTRQGMMSFVGTEESSGLRCRPTAV